MKKAILLILLLTAPAWAWEFQICDSGSANVTDDSYISSTSSSNFCGSSTLMIGSSSGIRKAWVAFWTLSDSLALPAYTGTVDSLKLVWAYQVAGEFSGADSMSVKARACRRTPVDCEITWSLYSTGNSWGTAGAGNTSTDVYDPPETDGVHADSVIIPASSAVYTHFENWLDPDHVAAENWILYGSWFKDNAARIWMLSRETSAIPSGTNRPKLVVYGSAGAGESVGVKFGANVSIGENVKVSK